MIKLCHNHTHIHTHTHTHTYIYIHLKICLIYKPFLKSSTQNQSLHKFNVLLFVTQKVRKKAIYLLGQHEQFSNSFLLFKLIIKSREYFKTKSLIWVSISISSTWTTKPVLRRLPKCLQDIHLQTTITLEQCTNSKERFPFTVQHELNTRL